MDISKKVAECLESKANYKGVCLEFSKTLRERLKEHSFINDISEHIESDDLRAYIKGDCMDEHMILYVIEHMLKDGDAKIVF
ncbi:MAG: hypothetical protein J6F30_04150, partial [Cellulosilyticum sp.]|nr:hypothetical protein [Cellulosilyticum sp.]